MRRAHQQAAYRLRTIETLMHLLQMTKAKRTPGPKPGGFSQRTARR